MTLDTVTMANAIAENVCKDWNIPYSLHELDYILIDGIKKMGVDAAVHSYFHSGRHEANLLSHVIDQLFNEGRRVKVLDFASGYGRVIRHLGYLSRRVDAYAADIHPEAVHFMQDVLGINSYLSTTEPTTVDLGSGYDFIYVLSLFSHLPEELFSVWLRCLYEKCSPGGYILFTTHGVRSIESNPVFFKQFYIKERGYGFKAISEQLDLKTSAYGTTVVSPGFVFDLLKNITPDAVLHSFTSGKWFGFASQDEYILHKPRCDYEVI